MNKKAFEKAIVGGIDVRNRIFRSATHEGVAMNDGKASPAMKEIYTNLSKGGVGLIITGYMTFSELDNYSPSTVSIANDDAIDSLTELAQCVHDLSCRVVAQIAHAGSQLIFAPTKDVLAPSDVTDPVSAIQPKPFSVEQIKKLVKEFGEAALRLKKADFDGVQIHGAHGYLLSKFLSPVYNKRTDAYGGSPENNVRIILEIIDSIKTACGEDFPVWIKLNSSDFGREENAYDIDGFLFSAKEIAKNGINAIEVSGGTITGKQHPSRSKKHEAYHLEYAKKLAAEVDTPLILVGGFRNIDLIESVLQENNIDAVSMCRPLIREPDLVKKWLDGDTKKAQCVACNGCFNPRGSRCFFELEGEEKEEQKQVLKMLAALLGSQE
ncbi:MAG: NADH:flavin oxidoreductase [Thermodesulfobacteriota bacterium]|nr:NADH:flavin oxidoreductase [Thermodesulfobacteriota bacterium]